MNAVEETTCTVRTIAHKFAQLGARMIAAYVTALIAAVLIFAAPEVGLLGAAGGVVMGGISAFLIHPHTPR